MACRFRRIILLVPMGFAMLFLPAAPSFCAEKAKTPDKGGAQAKSEAAAGQAAREERFLQRAVEDLGKTLAAVNGTSGLLKKQIDRVRLLEPLGREEELRDLWDWYLSYAEWLRGYEADFSADWNRALAQEPADSDWVNRYGEMARGYEKLESDLEKKVLRLEDRREDLEKRILRLRDAISLLTIRDTGEELPPYERNRQMPPRKERRKEELDAELVRLENEILVLAGMRKHFDVLIELGKFEVKWLSRKAADCAVLDEVARAVHKAPFASPEEPYNRIMRQYESDISYFKRQADIIDQKLAALAPTGTLSAMDRLEGLSEHYKELKRRYERHSVWLSQQIGGYRAEVTDILKRK